MKNVLTVRNTLVLFFLSLFMLSSLCLEGQRGKVPPSEGGNSGGGELYYCIPSLVQGELKFTIDNYPGLTPNQYPFYNTEVHIVGISMVGYSLATNSLPTGGKFIAPKTSHEFVFNFGLTEWNQIISNIQYHYDTYSNELIPTINNLQVKVLYKEITVNRGGGKTISHIKTTYLNPLWIFCIDGFSHENFGLEQEKKKDSEEEISIRPNPVRDEINLDIEIKKESKVTVSIFNQLGEKIIDLLEKQTLNKGDHNINKNISELSSGMYYIRININDKILIKKIVKL